LWAIWSFIALDDPDAADRLTARLNAAMNRLAQYPYLGHVRDGLAAGLRIFSVGNYQIVYRPGSDPVQVVHIAGPYQDVHTLAAGEP
jgi:plasmid stabilization system protein ParE